MNFSKLYLGLHIVTASDVDVDYRDCVDRQATIVGRESSRLYS